MGGRSARGGDRGMTASRGDSYRWLAQFYTIAIFLIRDRGLERHVPPAQPLPL